MKAKLASRSDSESFAVSLLASSATFNYSACMITKRPLKQWSGRDQFVLTTLSPELAAEKLGCTIEEVRTRRAELGLPATCPHVRDEPVVATAGPPRGKDRKAVKRRK